MIVPMKRLPVGSLFHIDNGHRGVFPRRSTCPKGEHPYQKTEDGKTVLHLLLVENIQQAPLTFVRSVYD